MSNPVTEDLQTNLSPAHQIGVITRLTIREARRRRMLWIGLALGGVFVGLFATGYYFAYRDFALNSPPRIVNTQEELFSNVFLTAALYVVNFLVVMVTALTVVGTVSSEVDSNTIHAIAAKPIRRWEIVLGKWLGHAALVTLYTLVLAVGVMAAVFFVNGYVAPNMIGVVLVLVLESLTVLSVTMLGSTLMSTLANGVMVFMLYGVAFIGGWVEQIGALFESTTARDLGIASSLLLPSEGLWRYAAALMQKGSFMNVAPSPFSVISEPSAAFLVYAGLYVLGLLGAAMWVFTQRDV